MIKMMFRNFLFGVSVVFGYLTGVELFNKLKNPVIRANIKKKLKQIKDSILRNEEA